MPRIPYLTDDQAGPPALVDAMQRRRGGALNELDRILLHSPPVADGWNAFFGRLRGELALPDRTRELAMCAVARLNGADYEWFHHAPLFQAAGGTQAQLDALGRLAVDADAALAEALWSAHDRAVLRAVVQSTRQVRLDDACFAEARSALGSDRLLFELLAVTAAYNMVSRLLVAFDVQPG